MMFGWVDKELTRIIQKRWFNLRCWYEDLSNDDI